MNKIKKMNKVEKSLLIVAILLTVFRIYIAGKIPMFMQGSAMCDDELLVNYAIGILKGHWLGSFNFLTYAKTAGFAIFLVIQFLSGIPYQIFLIGIYILSVLTFIKAISKIINNKYFLFIVYVFLLFSPVMFHVENVQKLYRGGAIVAFSLLTISSFIGMYANRSEKIKTVLKWSIFSSIALCCFWLLKEDSIWLLPFIQIFEAINIYYLCILNKKVFVAVKNKINNNVKVVNYEKNVCLYLYNR